MNHFTMIIQLVTPYRRPLFLLYSRSISEMSKPKVGGSGEQTETTNLSSRGHSRSRGRATDRRGRGRGAANAANPTLSAGGRPTHCTRPPSILHIHNILLIFMFQFQQFLLFLWYVWISCASLFTHYL